MASIDLDKPGKYPIVLSDALLGRRTTELFTGIRYNHKPDTSSSSPSSKLVPTSNDAYEIGIRDGSDSYTYEGIRKSGDGKYALIFDPVHKHFVLHQIDSDFDMNLTSTPWDQDPNSLQDSYDQLPGAPKARRKSAGRGATKAAATKANEAKSGGKNEPSGPSGAGDKKRKPEKKKKAVREPTPDAEDEDSDDGLTIEYPGGAPPPNRFQSRAMPTSSSASTYRREPSVDSDVDAEFEDDDDVAMGGTERNGDVEVFNLPSPVRGGGNRNNEDDDGGDDEDDLELDLEAELEMALEEADGKADESSESEEE